MIGRDGRRYMIVTVDKGEDSYFEVIDEQTNKIVDNGWLVISKNGNLRIERIK